MTTHVPAGVTAKAGILKKLYFVWSLSGVISEREGVSRVVQFRELLSLYMRRRLGPLVYYQQELWRPDISMQEKEGCLTNREFRIALEQHNPPHQQAIARHKVVEAAWLQLFRIPCSEFLGYLHPTDGVDAAGTPLTDAAALARLVEELCPIKLCFKPVALAQGRGFRAVEFERRGEELIARDCARPDSAVPLEDFLQEEIMVSVGDGLILQRYIEQHPVLAEINPSSVNTLRLWALQCGEQVKVRGAILRVGRAGMLVDNSSAGGLLAPVDIATGQVGKLKAMSVFPERLTHHPDSGAPVEGLRLPFWSETLELARQTLRVMPMLRFSGLDIAITPAGPVIVETNPRPSKISARNFKGSMRDLLDCSYD